MLGMQIHLCSLLLVEFDGNVTMKALAWASECPALHVGGIRGLGKTLIESDIW